MRDKLGMKRGQSGMFKTFLFIAVCSLLVFGCNDFFNKADTGEADMGLVRISIGDIAANGSGRTLLPSQLEDFEALYYVLTFTRDGNTVIEVLDGETSIELALPIGEWELDVRGYADESDELDPAELNPDDALVYFTDTIDVKLSGISVPVQLSVNTVNFTQTSTGILRYEITLPQEATGKLEIFKLTADASTLTQAPEAAKTVNLTGNIEYTDDLPLSSGFYNVYVSVSLAGKETLWQELAHIYDGAITLVAPDPFTESDIASPITAVAITAFNFAENDGWGDINIEGNTITVNITVTDVPDMTNLTPVITYTGLMIIPAPKPNTDFTSPVTFTIYTENGNANVYTVTVPCALGHDFSEWTETTPPACTTAAVETETCSRDGTLGLITQAGRAAHGHSFGAWAEKTPATCEEAGTQERICAHDAEHKETRDNPGAPALGHDFSVFISTTATCTAAGQDTYKCSRCDDTDQSERVALGHTFPAEWTTIPATCTEDGKQEKVCTVCDFAEYNSEYSAPALGHDFSEYIETTPYTCTQDGYETYACSRCPVTEQRSLAARHTPNF